MSEKLSEYSKDSQLENIQYCYTQGKNNLMWQYKCPKCDNDTIYEKAPKKCPKCGEDYNQLKWRIPPKQKTSNSHVSNRHLLPKDGFSDKKHCARWFAEKAGLNYLPYCATDDELSDFAHHMIAPNLSPTYRTLLFQFFTEIFRNEFEEGDFSAWAGTTTSGAGSTITVQSTETHHGDYALKAHTESTGGNAYAYYAVNNATLHARVYVRFSAWSATPDQAVTPMRFVDSSGNWVALARCDEDNWIVYARDGSSSVYDYSDSTTVAVDTWYCLELRWHSHSTSGEAKIWVDGTEQCSITGLDTTYYGNAGYVRIGETYPYDATSHDTYIDCVVISDSYIGGHVLFKDGLESGDFGEWDGTGSNNATGESNTDLAFTGAYSAEFESTADYGIYSVYKNLSDATRFNFRAYVQIGQVITTNDRFMGLMALGDNTQPYIDNSNDVEVWFGRNSGGTDVIQLRRYTPSTTTNEFSYAYLADVWYCLEIEMFIDSSSGYYKLYLDGTAIITDSGLDTSGATIQRAKIGYKAYHYPETARFDECLISDVYIGANHIFEEQFDTGNLDRWDSTTGNVSVVDTESYHGDYSLKCEGSSDYVTKTIPSTTNVWVRAYWKTEAIPATDYYSGYVFSGNGFEVRWNAMTGNGRWELLIDGSYGGSFIQTINPDVWYCVEVEFDADNNQHYLYIDGTQRISCANSTTTAITSINIGQISGNWGQNTYLDCVVISDSYIGVIELFEDDFESGDLSAWDGTVEGLNGDVSIESTITKNGSYSLKCYDDAWGGTAYVYWDNGTNLSSVYVRAYFRFESLPTSNGDYVSFIALRDMDDYVDRVGVSVYHDGSTANFRLTMTGGTTNFGSQVIADTWYCVEIFADWSSGNSTLYIDGSFDCSITDGDTGETTRYFKIGLTDRATTDHSYTFYVDDVVISNTYIGGSEQEKIVNLPFIDGFESGDFSAWSGENENQGSVDVTTANPHCGTYCLESTLSQGQNNGWGDCYTEISGNNPVYIRAMNCIFANPPNTATEDQTALCFRETTTGNGLAYAGIKNDNGTLKWWVWYRDEGSFNDQLGDNFDSEPHHLEFAIYQDSSAGWVRLYVDGELEIEVTGLNNADRELNYASVGFSYSDAPTDSTAKFYADCVVVDDTLIGPEQEETPPASAEAGFETGDVSEFDDTVTSSGTVTVTDSVAHHGTYSCKCDVNADGSAYAEGYFDVAEQQPVYCRGYFRFNQLPETNKDYTLICFENTDGPTTVGYIQLIDDNGTKQWKMMRSTGSVQYSTSTINIPEENKWVCVEFAHGENLAKLWVNGEELLTHIDATNQTINKIHIGACSTDMDADDTLEIYADCVVVDEEYIGPENQTGEIFADSFEGGSLPGAWDGYNGSINIVSSVKHHGTYCLESSTSDDFVYKDFTKKTTIHARAYYRFSELPTSAGYVNIMRICSGSGLWGTLIGRLQLRYTGSGLTLSLESVSPSATYDYNIAGQMSANNWYCFEVKFVKSISKGEWRVHFEGNEVIKQTQLDTSGNADVNKIAIGRESTDSINPTINVDCVVLDDTYIGTETDFDNIIVDRKVTLPSEDAAQLDPFEIVEAIYGWTVSFLNSDAPVGSENPQNKWVVVENGDLFSAGARVAIRDDSGFEIRTIASINDNTLTMTEPLSGNYTVAANGAVDIWTPAGFTLPDNRLELGNGPDETKLSQFLVRDVDSNAPLFVIDQGMVVKKDLTAGGFLGTNQGEVWIGHGRHTATDQPTIRLIHSGSKINGTANENTDFIPLKSTFGINVGDSVLVEDNNNSETKTVKTVNSEDSIGIYVTSNLTHEYTEEHDGYVHNYDTLHLKRIDGTYAGLNCGPVIISDNTKVHTDVMSSIFGWETQLLEADANEDDNTITLQNGGGSLFEVGDKIAISDENGYNNWEPKNPPGSKTITAINGDVLTLSSALENDYTVAKNARVSHWIPEGFEESENGAKPAIVFKDNSMKIAKQFCIAVEEQGDPITVFDHGVIFQKDVSAGGMLGVNQGAIFLGYGLRHAADPPKIVLQNYTSGFDTLHLFGLNESADQVLAHFKCADVYAETITNENSELVLNSPIAVRTLRKLRVNPEMDDPVLELLKNDAERVFLGHNGTNSYLSSRTGELVLDSPIAVSTLRKVRINPETDDPVLELRKDDAERVFLGHNGTDTFLSSRTGKLVLESPIAIETLHKLRINPETDDPVLELRKNDAERVFLGHNGTDTYISSRLGDLNLGSSDTSKTVVTGDLEVTGDIIGQITQVGEKGSASTNGNGEATITFNQAFGSTPLVFVQAIDASGRSIVVDVTAKSTTQFSVKAKIVGTHKHKVGDAAETASWTIGISSEDVHTHDYASTTGIGSSHRHSVAGTTGIGSAHNHAYASTTGIATVSLGSTYSYVGGNTANANPTTPHYHGFDGNAAVELAHSHGTHTHHFSSYTGDESSHTHYYAQYTDYESSHTHHFSSTSGSGSSHNHSLTGGNPAVNMNLYPRGISMRTSGGAAYGIGATLESQERDEEELYTEDSVLTDATISFDWMAIPA